MTVLSPELQQTNWKEIRFRVCSEIGPRTQGGLNVDMRERIESKRALRLVTEAKML